MLLYIHGFNSSSQSLKAQLTLEYCQQHFPELEVQVPQLACTPLSAMAQLEAIIQKTQSHGEQVNFIGSSLGGYFANYLCHKYGGKAVMVNPAVKPYELLLDYIGEQINPYTNEKYYVSHEHIDDLKSLDTPLVTEYENILLLQQSGDEVLDYRQAIWHYQSCQIHLESGGDHSFVNFDRLLPKIAEFLAL